ncbi:MAG TPA: hypothetical protein HA252_07240 [Candidatus Diapherotrites archaeon]|uniref:Uncharacterized protein n=1 Tax=Candidatus Iainarchaeum sp. TaxID=3101447 RepID=A0A7J4JKN1_9ARCH|nr:hypothetical protein [Candidatus Diapherotrites archaeon]HIH17169.1 hypothetical protein [Candidatus Diapherotrites archaeon]
MKHYDYVVMHLSAITIQFKGAPDEVLKALVKKGFAKTKAEAVRFALLHLGEEYGLITRRLHAKAEAYAYAEIKGT